MEHLGQSECSEVATEYNLENIEILKDITLDNNLLDHDPDEKTITLDDSFINVQKSLMTNFPHQNILRLSEVQE